MEDLKIITLNRVSPFLLIPRSINTKARAVCKVWHVNKVDGSIFSKPNTRKIEPSPLFPRATLLALFFCLLVVTSAYAWPFGPHRKHSNHISRKPPSKLDTIPPTGRISIQHNQRFNPAPKSLVRVFINSPQVTLNLFAQDNTGGSGISQMQFSNDKDNWPLPEAYTTTKTWALSSGDGLKTVYAKFSDKVGNWSQVYSATIILDTQGPSLAIISPQEGQVIKE